jgi:nicotinate-nucleotide pyrophosphorylase (carboxylating)
VESVVALALNEDIGTGDVSASLLKDEKVVAQIIVRESAIICGINSGTKYSPAIILGNDT